MGTRVTRKAKERVELKASILVVDDDERNAFAAVEALTALGHELTIANSGEEALRLLLKRDFAVILLDVHMPGMDGYETAALIRSRTRSRHIPIVFLTAVSRDETHLHQAYSAGAVDVVYKPVDPFVLRSKVSVLVDLHLKQLEITRQSEHRQRLLDDLARTMSEKNAAERALAQERERQETIIAALPIVFTARESRHPFGARFVSDSIEPMTGFTPGCFVDNPAFGLDGVHADDLEAVVKALEGAAKAGRYACEYRWKCADGTYRTLSDQGVLGPAKEGGEPEIFGTIEDVTERRALEQQLRQAQKMEAVGQLTGGVAHDFNNLLTVVLGNVDILQRRGELGERQRRQLAAIREAAQRGNLLTKQLLAFSRRQQLRPATVDVAELARKFAGLLKQAVGEAVEVHLSADEPVWAEVDPTQLEVALLNLAVNARDAMGEGGRLDIRVARDEAPDALGVIIQIADSGAGMEPHIADKIFEPFFTTKDVGKGSGLGLSQVYGFVQQSSGCIDVRTAPGQGSTFTLMLPASEPEFAIPAEAPQPVAAVGGCEHILVVEDDPTVRTIVVESLQNLGYRVTTADRAEAALTAFAETPVDMVFSDVVMPGGATGIDLALRLREIRPETPILLTSGFVDPGASRSPIPFPMIDKPYALEELASRVREVLDARPVASDPATKRSALRPGRRRG